MSFGYSFQKGKKSLHPEVWLLKKTSRKVLEIGEYQVLTVRFRLLTETKNPDVTCFLGFRENSYLNVQPNNSTIMCYVYEWQSRPSSGAVYSTWLHREVWRRSVKSNLSFASVKGFPRTESQGIFFGILFVMYHAHNSDNLEGGPKEEADLTLKICCGNRWEFTILFQFFNLMKSILSVVNVQQTW